MNSLFRALGYKVRFFFFVFIKGYLANLRDEETGDKRDHRNGSGGEGNCHKARKPEFDSQNPHGMCEMTSTYTQNTYFFSK